MTNSDLLVDASAMKLLAIRYDRWTPTLYNTVDTKVYPSLHAENYSKSLPSDLNPYPMVETLDAQNASFF